MQINRLILSFFIPAIAWLAVAQSETDTMNSKFIIFSVLLTLGALTAKFKRDEQYKRRHINGSR